MNIRWEVLLGAAIIAASIVFIGRYTISAVGYGSGQGSDATSTENVYRLDRWTGQIEYCPLGGSNPADNLRQAFQIGRDIFDCGVPKRPAQ